jgi:hypothetical protein
MVRNGRGWAEFPADYMEILRRPCDRLTNRSEGLARFSNTISVMAVSERRTGTALKSTFVPRGGAEERINPVERWKKAVARRGGRD